jgi:hypothetical protein
MSDHGGRPTLAFVSVISTIVGASVRMIPLGQVTSKFSPVLTGAPSFAGFAKGGRVDLLSMPEVYTLPIPAHLRLAVENFSQLVTDGDELQQTSEKVLVAAE